MLKKSTELDLNNYIAFNYFKMSLNHGDTRDEAMMKLGDYYYYGLPPIEKPQVSKAARLFKQVE